MNVHIHALPGTVADPLYPDSEAEAVGETDFHMNALIWLREALKDYFAGRTDIYVASDMFWYWEQGNPRASKAPDAMVVKGVGNHARRSFRSWEENAQPCVIFELASERNWQEDIGDKRDLYARLGVAEYFVFDPEGVYLDPPFQGFRLDRGQTYAPMMPASDGSLTSHELGLRLVAEGTMLRLRNARTGRRVLTRAEQTERADRRTERARQRTMQETQRAEQQRQRADQLAAELARLRAQGTPPAQP